MRLAKISHCMRHSLVILLSSLQHTVVHPIRRPLILSVRLTRSVLHWYQYVHPRPSQSGVIYRYIAEIMMPEN